MALTQPSLPRSRGLGDNALPGFSIAARRSNTFILAASVSGNTHRPPALPPPRHIPARCQRLGHRYLRSRSSPSLQLRSASAIPPGDRGGGTGLCSTAAVSPSQETASINRRHIHPLLTWGWPFPGWARAQATLLVSRQSPVGGWRGAGRDEMRQGAGRGDGQVIPHGGPAGGALDQPRALWLWPETRWVISRCAVSGLPLFLCGQIYKS